MHYDHFVTFAYWIQTESW